jgi:hypothetical protein
MVDSATSNGLARRRPAIFARPLRLAAVALVLLASRAHASTTIFNDAGTICTATKPCWQAGEFGLLIGLGTAVGNTGTLVETGGGTDNLRGLFSGGDIGIGASSTINTSGGSAQTWTGPIDFADTGSSHSNGYAVPSSSDVLTNVTISGGTRLGDAEVTSALSQVASISGYFKSLTGTNLGNLTGTTTIGTIGGGVQVYKVSSINLNGTLTIKGGANDLVIINDPNVAYFNSGSKVVLSGGITVDQVLFNLTGTSNNILSINGGTGSNQVLINADIITHGSYFATNVTVDGRILGGYHTITLGPGYEMSIPNDVAPEPAEWAMLAGGFGLLVYLSRKFRPRLGSRFAGAGLQSGTCPPGAAILDASLPSVPVALEPAFPPPRDSIPADDPLTGRSP